MLILFVLLVWGMLGMAALTIDWGFVTLTRVHMQNAVDTAVLEGLRQRDALGLPDGTSDAARREAAGNFVAWHFDNDIDLETDDPFQFGAGPQLQLDGGITEEGIAELNASQQLSVSDSPVFKPLLESNATNASHGDLVSGDFLNVSEHTESSDYTRSDFLPADQASSPSANAFLVRLRRTNDLQGLDRLEGISSAGDPLPLLFGLGSTIQATENGIRQTGFSVRATAIADARPAFRVGFPVPLATPPILGATPFALTLEFWNSLTEEVPTPAVVNASGAISTGSHPNAGRFTPPPPDPNTLNTVGQAIPDPTVPSSESVDLTGYVPIFTVVSGVNRVIGFGMVAIAGSTPGVVQITRLTSRIAPANATRHLTEGFPDLSDEALSTVLNLNEIFDGALLVPVLAR